MTRYSEDHKANTRSKIIGAASALFRRQGYAATGIDAIMERAKLTAGGFYAHFPSKISLLRETFATTVRDVTKSQFQELSSLCGVPWLKAVIRRYLGPEHFSLVEKGCPIPPLLSELGRSDAKTKKEFEKFLIELVNEFGHLCPPGPGLSSKERLLATLCLMFGGMTVARAVDDERLALEILTACRRFSTPEISQDQSKIPVETDEDRNE